MVFVKSNSVSLLQHVKSEREFKMTNLYGLIVDVAPCFAEATSGVPTQAVQNQGTHAVYVATCGELSIICNNDGQM
jgi:hypothetical protein